MCVAPMQRKLAQSTATLAHLGRPPYTEGLTTSVTSDFPCSHPHRYEDVQPLAEVDDEEVSARIEVPNSVHDQSGFNVLNYRPPPAVPDENIPGAMQDGCESRLSLRSRRPPLLNLIMLAVLRFPNSFRTAGQLWWSYSSCWNRGSSEAAPPHGTTPPAAVRAYAPI